MAAVALCAAPAAALPKAFYVKQGDKITKYNFGVAENLVFSDNGHTLSVRGYGQSVNLDEIDYISFTAPLAEALTPSEQKERMVKIGTKAYSAFDINDQADVLRMCTTSLIAITTIRNMSIHISLRLSITFPPNITRFTSKPASWSRLCRAW